MAKDKMYSVGRAGRNQRGVRSTVIAGISIVMFLILCAVCAGLDGAAPQWVGAAGMSALLLSFYGMICGLQSFRDRAMSYGSRRAGTIMNGLMVGVWFVLFCVGLAG